jgi:hypothetical protein
MENNDKNYAGIWVIYTLASLAAWIALIIAKSCGSVGLSWIAVALAIVWIPFMVLLLSLAIMLALNGIAKALKRYALWKRRWKTAKALREAMEGLTLNQIGPIYGVKRQQGEKNREYKHRILKAARTVDTVNVQRAPRKPATLFGEGLDKAAEQLEMQRNPGENDAQFRNRVAAEIDRRYALEHWPEEGGKNGLQNRSTTKGRR